VAEHDVLRGRGQHQASDQAVAGAEAAETTAPSKRVVFLVPRRNDDGWRDRVWAYARARWERYFPDVEVVEGHHDDGSFNRSAAVNRAAKLAGDWDVGIVIDSDVMIDQAQGYSAIATAVVERKVTWGHTRWRGFAESWTERWIREKRDLGPTLDRDEMDLYVERTNPLSWSCFIAIPREVFDDMGGFDERFRGWGFEDMAFQSVVVGKYPWTRMKGDIIHLWHPRSDERIILGQTRTTASDDYIRNGLLGRRYMLALRRDHFGHDRANVADESERQRDMNNLRRDDEKFLAVAKQRKMPEADWSSWWPTLDELIEGARAHVAGPEPTITVVVHTGGTSENWSTRKRYLVASLDSLTARLRGPIVQRVVYSDWGDEYRDELRAIVEPFGFYVAGEGHHGYTASMGRMWRYLAKRAVGEYVFQAEDDFEYVRDVDLAPMIDTLRVNPDLQQIALLRDAFYQDEKETGGILGWPEPAFSKQGWKGHYRLEHRLFFTANPSLFRRSLTETPWPTDEQSRRVLGRRPDQSPSSETAFGRLVLADPKKRVAFWGAGEEWIRHIGAVRAGVGY